MSTYSQYLSNLKKVQESRLNIEILPCLTNEGSSPAEDIDISLEFPEEWLNLSDDIKLLKETDLPEFPIEPTRPTPPFSSISDIHRQLASHSFFLDLMPRIHSHGERGSPSQTGPKIDEPKMSVHYWHSNLKHGMGIELKPLYVWYSSINRINTFKIEYSINFGNHPKVKEGELAVVIKSEETSDH